MIIFKESRRFQPQGRLITTVVRYSSENIKYNVRLDGDEVLKNILLVTNQSEIEAHPEQRQLMEGYATLLQRKIKWYSMILLGAEIIMVLTQFMQFIILFTGILNDMKQLFQLSLISTAMTLIYFLMIQVFGKFAQMFSIVCATLAAFQISSLIL